jgi:hypothetical protein
MKKYPDVPVVAGAIVILTRAILFALTDNDPDTSKVELNIVAPKTFDVEFNLVALAAIKF